MEKTKLGISVGILGAIVYFSAALLGYISLFIVGGYILFTEKNQWLRKCVIKAVVLMLLYSLVTTVLGLLPELFSVGSGETSVLGGFYIYLALVYQVFSAIIVVLNIARVILVVVLGVKALD